jgi:surface antigen Omp85-like protein
MGSLNTVVRGAIGERITRWAATVSEPTSEARRARCPPSLGRSPLLRNALPFGCAFAAFFGACLTARADNPLNSSEKPDTPAVTVTPEAAHNDFTIVPVAGGSSDIGFGGGFFAGLTRIHKGYDPFVWHLEAAGFVSFASRNQALDLPYVDLYSKVTITRFLGVPLQLEIRPSFTEELTLYYYGMGNASSAIPPTRQSVDFFHYARRHPELLADLRFKLLDHVAGRIGVRYVQTWFDIPADSKLAEDIRSGSLEVKRLIGPTGTEGAALFRYGVQFDDRDNETSPHEGTFDDVTFNWSPGGVAALPFRYGEVSATLRGYIPLFSPRVTLAVRVVGDVLFGDVPLYELSRAVDNYAIGGSNGVRGVPAQRYYGKVKAFGNFEVRAKLFDFKALGKALSMGCAAFFDGGRVWADTSPHPELDGSSVGLKYGIGGGLRLMSGSAFVLRGDIAWSPDATPVGGYVIAGEIF